MKRTIETIDGYKIEQVGRRWFVITGNRVNVEATFHVRSEWTKDEKKSKEAGYTVWNGKPTRGYTFTGKGARRDRDKLIAILELNLGDLEA